MPEKQIVDKKWNKYCQVILPEEFVPSAIMCLLGYSEYYVPTVYPDNSSDQVLVAELISGTMMV